MGNNYVRQKQYKVKLDKFELKILCKRISEHGDLEIKRRMETFTNLQKNIGDGIKKNTISKRELVGELLKAVKILNEIQAIKSAAGYLRSIEENAEVIIKLSENNKFEEIENLMPKIEGVILCAGYFIWMQFTELTKIVTGFWNQEFYLSVRNSERIHKDLKACFEEINSHRVRNCLDIILNRCGIHETNSSILLGVKST